MIEITKPLFFNGKRVGYGSNDPKIKSFVFDDDNAGPAVLGDKPVVIIAVCIFEEFSHWMAIDPSIKKVHSMDIPADYVPDETNNWFEKRIWNNPSETKATVFHVDKNLN